ncbi:MAG: hypothetical protein ACKV0T_21820 [Planctomycetales bacterium]
MLLRIRFALLLSALLPFGLACCSDKGDLTKSGQGTAAGSQDQIPETADAAILRVVEGLRRQDPEPLWHFLPASYQSDINGLIHQFAERMDPEVWEQTIVTLRKLARILKSQQALIQEALTPPGGTAPPGSSSDWGSLAELLESLLASELGDLERLKTADGGKFLRVTGSQWLKLSPKAAQAAVKDPFSVRLDELEKMQVKLRSTDGDTAVVRIDVPGANPEEAAFVRVESKWIPKNLADGWYESIGEARARLSLLSAENLEQLKPRLLTTLESLNKALDQMAVAKDVESLQSAALVAVLSLAPLSELAQGVPLEGSVEPTASEQTAHALPPVGKSELITLLVLGPLEGSTQDEVVEQLTTAVGAGDRTVCEITGDDETTSIKLGPITDLEAFARQLDFMEIVQVDAGTRTITARIKRGR